MSMNPAKLKTMKDDGYSGVHVKPELQPKAQ